MKTLSFHLPKAIFITMLLLAVSLLFTGCSIARAQNQGNSHPGDTQPPATKSPETNHPGEVLSSDDLARIDPNAVLLELAYEPTFSRIEASYLYGRPPVFVLLADGRVIYTEEDATYENEQVKFAQLSREEVLALMQQVHDLGFSRLKSFTDFCFSQPGTEQRCVADASYTILRMRDVSAELKEVKIYADFANYAAAFTSISDLLSTYSYRSAQLYKPEKAALFLSKESGEVQPNSKAWPLDPAILQFSPSEQGLWAVVLEGQALTSYLETTGSNVGDAFFTQNGTTYRAYLVPWLPGADYSTELHSDFSSQ